MGTRRRMETKAAVHYRFHEGTVGRSVSSYSSYADRRVVRTEAVEAPVPVIARYDQKG
jgi:hypothetical protein